MRSKSNKKRILASLLALLMLFTISGCGSGEAENPDAEPGQVIAQNEETITIVDQAGREVTVKRDIDSIALSYRVAIRFLLSLNQGDKIKGIDLSRHTRCFA